MCNMNDNETQQKTIRFEKELIENCQASLEMLSQDTILSRHPYVNDVEDEKEKIDKEKKAEAEKNESDYNKIIKELRNKTEDGSSKVGDK